jgi:hypothetical protein
LNSELIEILGAIEANDDLDRLQAARDRALLYYLASPEPCAARSW